MSERFVFTQHPTLQELEQKRESPKGQMALAQIRSEFTSVADVLHHTHQFGPDSSRIELASGDHITLVNVSKAEFAADVKPYTAFINRNFF